MRRTALTVLLCVAASGCASYTAMAPDEREQLQRELTAQDAQRYARLSFFVTPFFGDASKKLLTDVPPGQVRLLNDTKGNPIDPGAVERLVPAGRKVRIQQVEFPTSWVVTGRVVYTPRTQPWVYLSIDGEPNELPYILVLRPQIKTPQEFHAELERYLVREDPAPRLEAFAPPIREAIARKEAVVEMPEEALLMAWGYPEVKKVAWEDQVRKETWLWAGRKRTAVLTDGRVSALEDPK